MWKRALSSGASFACFSFLTSFMCFFSYSVLFLLSSPSHHDFLLLVSRRPLDFQSYFSSMASAFRHRPLSTTPPPTPPSFSSSASLRERQSTASRFPSVTEGDTWQTLSDAPTLFAGADTPLMTLAHLPVSLVFLATLFLLLAVSGRGAAKPVDGETGDVRVSWLQNEPQIAAKLRLFTHRGTALQRDDCWQRCHPVIAENSFPHLLPPPQGFHILCSFLRPILSSLFALQSILMSSPWPCLKNMKSWFQKQTMFSQILSPPPAALPSVLLPHSCIIQVKTVAVLRGRLTVSLSKEEEKRSKEC